MPELVVGGRRSSRQGSQRGGQYRRWVAHLPNSRLHLALLVSAGAALLIALAVPVRHSHASIREAVEGPFSTSGELDGVPFLRQRAVEFTLHEEGLVAPHVSFGLTVGQALAGLGVRLNPYDRVVPPPDTILTPGLHVYVRHARQVELNVSSVQQTLYTHVGTVGDLLAEAGVRLEPLDRVSPGLATPILQGMRVDVTVVREVVERTEEPIPFTIVYWDDADLLQGKERLVQGGSDGHLRREYLVRYENGVEVSRQFVGETREAPTPRIIARGTRAPDPPKAAAALPQDPQECPRTLMVYATWYTAASAGGSGLTRTGVPVAKGVVAVDPSVIPLGTRMFIPGYGPAVAADTGGGIRGNMIDLGYGLGDVYDWASRWVEICLLD